MKNIELDPDKLFYTIGEVATMFEVNTSLIRFWEKEFTIIKPKRNAKNTRFYTPQDIETIRKVYYLVKEKGLKLDAAQAEILHNRQNIDRTYEVVERLKNMREELLKIQDALDSVK